MTNYITLSGMMLVLILLFTFRPLRRLPARPLLLTGAVLLALTFVFDNLIVGAGIVGYDDSLILGIRVPIAPIEDFAYAIGAMLLIPAVWEWNSRLAPRDHGSTTPGEGSGAPAEIGDGAPGEFADDASAPARGVEVEGEDDRP